MDPDRRDALYRSLVDDAFGFTVAIADDFTIAFVSRSAARHVGYEPEELRGEAMADHVHPDDLERALLLVGGWSDWGAPQGNATFRVRSKDGGWISFDVTAAQVHDGEQHYLAVYSVPVDYQHATDEVLRRLLDGAGRREALEPVLDVFSWKINDAKVAIAWSDDGEHIEHVSTDLPPRLSGLDWPDDGPWARARATGEPFLDLGRPMGCPELEAEAVAAGRGGVWIVPVADPASGVPATVTLWSRLDGPRPDGHAYGMSIATTYIELILRWTHQVALLNAAARRDPLTGLGNRKALFDALGTGGVGGALLYCDLDRFKPVNDLHGHAAGDQVLAEIAARIRSAVRSTDLVARAGGDEFVVLAHGAGAEQAAALAERICAAVDQPIEVSGEPVRIGITIGVAMDPDDLTESTLAHADAALMSAKVADRGSVRWHSPA